LFFKPFAQFKDNLESVVPDSSLVSLVRELCRESMKAYSEELKRQEQISPLLNELLGSEIVFLILYRFDCCLSASGIKLRQERLSSKEAKHTCNPDGCDDERLASNSTLSGICFVLLPPDFRASLQ
jgi:hypothetical protein